MTIFIKTMFEANVTAAAIWILKHSQFVGLKSKSRALIGIAKKKIRFLQVMYNNNVATGKGDQGHY